MYESSIARHFAERGRREGREEGRKEGREEGREEGLCFPFLISSVLDSVQATQSNSN